MKIKTLAVLSVVAVLATAPSAFAFGGGGKKGHSGGGGSVAGFSGGGSVVSTTPSAVAMPAPGPVSAPEPFAGLAVGLGLLGARLLRRRS